MTQPDVPLSTATPAKPRVLWVDYAKGLSIFLVVAYHVMNGFAKRPDVFAVPRAWDLFINPTFEMVRMPLFFFVSGLFIGRSAQKDARTFITDKLGAIAWPYVIWSTIQTVVAIVLAGSRTQVTTPLRDLPYALAFRPVDQFWFLYVLFLALMLYFALVKLRLRPWMILVVGVGLLLVKLNVNFKPLTIRAGGYRIGPEFWPPLFQLFNFFIYMALGAVLAPTLLKNVGRLKSIVLVVVALLTAGLIVAAMRFIDPHVVVEMGRQQLWPILRRDTYVSLSGLRLPVGIVFALLSVACALSVAVLLQRGRIASFVKTMGQYSLYIFVLHVIFAAGIRTVMLKAHVTHLGLHIVMGLACGVFFSIAVGVLAKKTKTTWLFSLRA